MGHAAGTATRAAELFAAILIFLDQQITARVVNAPAFKLQKGPGYHLDLLLVGGLTALCSLLGWPWLVALASPLNRPL